MSDHETTGTDRGGTATLRAPEADATGHPVHPTAWEPAVPLAHDYPVAVSSERWEPDVPLAHDYLSLGDRRDHQAVGRRPPDTSMAHLHAVARRLRVPRAGTMSKVQLISAIREADRGALVRSRRW